MNALKSYLTVAGIVAAVLLAGCASMTTNSPQSTSAIPIVVATGGSEPKPMKTTPASLGLLAPEVPNYQCKGVFYPASQVNPTQTTAQSQLMMPAWQLNIRCVNPELKFDLPKGMMRAGMVWITEQPMNAPSLSQAMLSQRPVSDLKLSSVGNLRVGTGRIAFGGYTDNALWFFGGKTTWMGLGQHQTGTVVVYVTGRAVSMRTLKQFANSMHLLSH